MKDIFNNIHQEIEDDIHYFSQVGKDVETLRRVEYEQMVHFLDAFEQAGEAENEDEMRKALRRMSRAVATLSEHVNNFHVKAEPRVLDFEKKYFPPQS